MATIKDVAQKAGVTVGTVSRAFNGYSDISEKTRQSILRVAAEMGYVPNLHAKSLSLKNKTNIAMLISGILDEHQTDEIAYLLMKGAYQFAQEANFEIATYAIDRKSQQEKTYAQFCYEHSLGGALLFGLRTVDPYFKNLKKSTAPCVAVDVSLKGPNVGSVMIDDEAAFDDLTEYLIRNGHRSIAVLYGRRQAEVSVKRWAGARRAFERHGIACPKEQVLYTDFSQARAYRLTKEYLQRYKTSGATAFLCMSDITAIGAMQAIKETGYRVPQDFSIVGYDGLNITRYTDPGITTIDQNTQIKGYAAAKLLSEIMADPKAARQIVLPHRLVVRGSVRRLEK